MPDYTKEQVRHRVELLQQIIEARRPHHEFQYYGEYIEPGYTDPACGVIALGNWNSRSHRISGGAGIELMARAKVEAARLTTGRRPVKIEVNHWGIEVEDETMPRVAKILEKLGCELEWEDEWSSCGDCGRLFRTSSNSYGWQPSHAIVGECDDLCHECILENPEDYLQGLEGNTRSGATFDIDLEKYDYVKLEGDFENGWHPGQDADPRVIGKSLRELGIERFLFVIDSVSQFDLSFSVWVHKENLPSKEQMEKWEDADKRAEISPNRQMQKYLSSISAAEAKVPPGPGPIIVRPGDDGLAVAHRCSPTDFIDGRAFDSPTGE